VILYATTDDLATWSPSLDQPANANEVLRSACLLIAKALNEDVYNPSTISDPHRRDASCAQATAWILSSLDPTAGVGGITGKAKQKTVGGASIVYDIPTAQTREDALALLCPDAMNILYSAALLWVPLPTWSDMPDAGLYVNELNQVGGSWNWPAWVAKL
jgi:hypothetical protein